MSPDARSPSRPKDFLVLTAAISATVFIGFWFTYFEPMSNGAYPPASPAVHVHGWSFFAWYLLLPLQAVLVNRRQLALHRTLGTASIALAVVMVLTGLLVVGVQARAALDSPTPTFWTGTAPMIFATLVLFAAFYFMAWRDRRQRAQHKRWIVVASAAGMGAAMFRIFMVTFGPQDWVVPASILVTNAFIAAGMLGDRARGEQVQSPYLIGLVVCALTELGVYILTPTPPGQGLMHTLAWIGRSFGFLY